MPFPERPSESIRHRIGIGGIAIESSTFSPLLSTLEDFTVLRGDAMLERYPFMPGWSFRGRTDVAWLPCLQATALPGGPVTAEMYRTLKRDLLDRVRAALPLDGFSFDVHGAMTVQGLDDAEADLAGAIRELVGPACLISAGMDLHGNVSAQLVETVDLFTTYRHAPHTDVLETRERACANLLRCLDEGTRPLRAWTRIPVILPGERTSTVVEPGRSVYASLAASDDVPGVLDASLWVGYVWADQPRSSASVVITGTDIEQMKQDAARIARRYWDSRHAFGFCLPAGTADWCIAQAVAQAEQPVMISDSGDNVTAGAAGDVTYFLERLLAHPAFASGDRTAIYASLTDAAAVAACIAAGEGQDVSVSLGGKLDPVHGQPLPVRGQVITLITDETAGGPIAVLLVGGVHIIVTSRRIAYRRIHEFTALGLDPAAHHVTVVKLGYLEPELATAAKAAYLALTPGAANLDIPSLPYHHLSRPIFPLDPDMPNPEFDVRIFGV